MILEQYRNQNPPVKLPFGSVTVTREDLTSLTPFDYEGRTLQRAILKVGPEYPSYGYIIYENDPILYASSPWDNKDEKERPTVFKLVS